MLTANFFDDTFSYNMVRQAAKWLDADDVRNTAVDQLHHFSGQEPSFTGLVSGRNDRCGHFCKIMDICGRCEVAALLQGFVGGFSQPVDGFQAKVCNGCLGLFEAKFLNLEVLVVEAVADKVNKVRNNRFCAFCFQKICQMVVGSRQELDKDLTYDTNARFFLIGDRDGIKIVNHFTAHFFEGTMADAAACYKGNGALLPDLVLAVYDTFFQLVRTHAVYTFHQDIAEYSTVNDTFDQRQSQLESRIALQSA